MKVLSIIFLFIISFLSCQKAAVNQQVIHVPNGDFESWDNLPLPDDWHTNSCPPCVPPYETYIVKKVTDAAHGQFAAEFIYNSVYSSYADNKFAVSSHPSFLQAYIKSGIANGDTATIHIDLFSGKNIVDSGNFYETSSHAIYRKIEIPVSQNSTHADSASIFIKGGNKLSTVFYVDNLVLIKNN